MEELLLENWKNSTQMCQVLLITPWKIFKANQNQNMNNKLLDTIRNQHSFWRKLNKRIFWKKKNLEMTMARSPVNPELINGKDTSWSIEKSELAKSFKKNTLQNKNRFKMKIQQCWNKNTKKNSNNKHFKKKLIL